METFVGFRESGLYNDNGTKILLYNRAHIKDFCSQLKIFGMENLKSFIF